MLDSGILATHPALADRIDQTLCRDFTTGDSTGMVSPYGLQDPHGHGTHVAGIIGANGTSVTGACWGVALVSLRVFDASNSGSAFNVKLAIDFASKSGIPILNYSGGGTTNDQARFLAIQQYPGLFVCAAGNNASNNDTSPRYPTNWTVSLPNLISVGAITIDTTTNTERIAALPDPGWNSAQPGSNYGATTVDLFAPGTAIYSTFNNSSYEPMSGTSMATPYVTGVAALVKALHQDMTGAQLKTALRAGVNVLPQLNGKCITNGKINAYKAVTYIPIVGSVDVNFMGSTTIVNGSPLQTATGTAVGNVLIGKFHLFTNGTWALVEMGKLSNPIVNYYAWDPPRV